MRTREEQTAVIKADQQFWRDLAAEVGPDRYDEPGTLGEWSFGDLAGHLVGWRDRTIARLEAAARGEPDPMPFEPDTDEEVDAMNVTIRNDHAGRPAAELVDAFTDSYDRLIRALDALPDSMLTDPKALPFVGGAADRHHVHRPSPRGARARRPRLARPRLVPT